MSYINVSRDLKFLGDDKTLVITGLDNGMFIRPLNIPETNGEMVVFGDEINVWTYRYEELFNLIYPKLLASQPLTLDFLDKLLTLESLEEMVIDELDNLIGWVKAGLFLFDVDKDKGGVGEYLLDASDLISRLKRTCLNRHNHIVKDDIKEFIVYWVDTSMRCGASRLNDLFDVDILTLKEDIYDFVKHGLSSLSERKVAHYLNTLPCYGLVAGSLIENRFNEKFEELTLLLEKLSNCLDYAEMDALQPEYYEECLAYIRPVVVAESYRKEALLHHGYVSMGVLAAFKKQSKTKF